MDCIFCKIAAGEIPCRKVYEDDQLLAFHDIEPQAPVHILVIPKQHIANILDCADNPEILVAAHQLIRTIAADHGLTQPGLRVVTNVGDQGGQSVKHLHWHILGGRDMQWPPG